MTEPMLDGKPVGPSPTQLHEVYKEAVLAAAETLVAERPEYKKYWLPNVRRRLAQKSVETDGLRAVYEAGRQSILRQMTSLDVVMTTLPHAHGEFVELEDEHGRSVGPSSGIDWVDQGDTWALRIPGVLLEPFPRASAAQLDKLAELQDRDGAPE